MEACDQQVTAFDEPHVPAQSPVPSGGEGWWQTSARALVLPGGWEDLAQLGTGTKVLILASFLTVMAKPRPSTPSSQ